MNTWKALQKGDLIDIIAPAWPSSLSEMKKGIAFLEDQGFSVRLQENILKKDLIYASNLPSRQAGLKKALFAEDSQAVLCLRGGHGSLHLIPSLMRRKKPKKCKVFIGSSDISLLHHFINQKWNWPSFHGSMLTRLGNQSSPFKEKKEFLQVLMGKTTSLRYKNLKPLNGPAKEIQTIKGTLAGGNLITLQTSLGTALHPKTQNKILFFEEVGERAYRIDRVLHHFHLAKAFSGVKAIILGDFLNSKEDSLMFRILSRFFVSLKCPVFKGLPCGHGPLQRMLPLNTPCILQIKPQTAELFCQTGVEKT